jgi:hypothetical protein
MFCNALMFAPDRIASDAAVCRSSCNLKSVGNPASDRALAHQRRRTLLARIQPPAESGNTRASSAPGASILATVAGMRRCDPYRSWVEQLVMAAKHRTPLRIEIAAQALLRPGGAEVHEYPLGQRLTQHLTVC